MDPKDLWVAAGGKANEWTKSRNLGYQIHRNARGDVPTFLEELKGYEQDPQIGTKLKEGLMRDAGYVPNHRGEIPVGPAWPQGEGQAINPTNHPIFSKMADLDRARKSTQGMTPLALPEMKAMPAHQSIPRPDVPIPGQMEGEAPGRPRAQLPTEKFNPEGHGIPRTPPTPSPQKIIQDRWASQQSPAAQRQTIDNSTQWQDDVIADIKAKQTSATPATPAAVASGSRASQMKTPGSLAESIGQFDDPLPAPEAKRGLDPKTIAQLRKSTKDIPPAQAAAPAAAVTEAAAPSVAAADETLRGTWQSAQKEMGEGGWQKVLQKGSANWMSRAGSFGLAGAAAGAGLSLATGAVGKALSPTGLTEGDMSIGKTANAALTGGLAGGLLGALALKGGGAGAIKGTVGNVLKGAGAIFGAPAKGMFAAADDSIAGQVGSFLKQGADEAVSAGGGIMGSIGVAGKHFGTNESGVRSIGSAVGAVAAVGGMTHAAYSANALGVAVPSNYGYR